FVVFFFQAEDGIRGFHVTGVQTCALPIYADGVATVGEADGAGRLGAAEGVVEPTVGTGLAVGDAPQLVPDAALERGAVRAQREGELLQLAREVRRQLLPRLGEGGVVAVTEGLLGRAVALLGHVEATQDAVVVGDEGQRAVGAVDHGVLLHGLLFSSAHAGLIRTHTGSYRLIPGGG